MSRFVFSSSAAFVLLSVLGASSLASSLVGCTPKSERVVGSRAAATEETIDRNDILDDASMEDDTMTATQVQSFLETTPYGHRSVLASYKPKGKLASKIMADTAREYRINPMLLVVRVQMEQSLISKTSATSHELDRAFGCGCVDGASSTTTSAPSAHTCSSQYLGFENQVRCSAATLRHALDGLAGTKHATISGWATGKAKTTLDGVSITPKNDATAALYSYTPWVGKLGGGSSKVGGNSAHWKLWKDFVGGQPDPDPSRDVPTGNNGDLGNTPSPSGNVINPPQSQPSCEGTCRYGEVCDDSEMCVPGCRVIGNRDTCGSNSRCDRDDGLVGRCVQDQCSCSYGTFCDPSSGSQNCVECTYNETSNCRAEGQGEACVAGRCGCRTSADCGYDRGRICDPLRGVCVLDPNPSSSYPQPNDTLPGTGTGTGTAGDAGTSQVPSDPTLPTDAIPTTPDTQPAPTPDIPSTSSSSSGKDSGAEEAIDVPQPSSNGGCSAASSTSGAGSLAWAMALGIAVALGRRRRG